VGTAVAGPGERAAGHLTAALPGGEEVEIACWVLHGHAPGPVLYLHSTQHGNEITGIEVVRRVAQALDPRRLRGTLIAVPIANPPAFRWRRHHYGQAPDEGYQEHPEKDMGQAWPGDPAGTLPQRLAHALWDGAVRHATHVLDLHTWNRWQAAATTVDAWHAPSLALAQAFGLWVQARWQPAPPGESASRSVMRVAIEHGKAACSPNFTGQWDIPEPEVRRGVAGVRRVLRALGMWPARAAPAVPVTFTTAELITVAVPEAGIFLPRVRPEQRVRRGQVLGELVRLSDFRAMPVQAPVEALVYLIGAIGTGADVALPPMMPVAQAGGRVARLLPVPAGVP
jgi:predicted deacylase